MSRALDIIGFSVQCATHSSSEGENMRSFNSYPLWQRIFGVWIAVFGPYVIVRLMNDGYLPSLKAFYEGPYWWISLIPGGLIMLRWLFFRRR